MRKIVVCIIFVLIFSTVSVADDYDLFVNHGSVMLIINPDTGEIVFGNNAASEFYKCTIEELLDMNISDINILTHDEITDEMALAKVQDRNYFNFTHLICDGSIRHVEVYSYPIEFMNEQMLFSIVIDVTDRIEISNELQVQNERNKEMLIDIIYAILIVLFIILLLTVLILRSNRKLKFLSVYDPLTKVLNRVVARDVYNKYCDKNKIPIAFYMIDVNNLKFINDTFGHITGDDMIVRIANRLSVLAGNKGIVARVSGDEFVVVLNCIDAVEAHAIEKSIKKISIKLKNIHFDVSVGMLHIANEMSYDTAFSIAESKMYTGKSLGRDDNNKRIEREMLYHLYVKHPNLEKQVLIVQEIIVYLGEKLNLTSDDIKDIKEAARVQDIGLVVSDDVNEQSFNHPEKGASILNAIGKSYSIVNTIMHHHEYYDGTGYPKGLKGMEIPLSSRLLLFANHLYLELINNPIDNALRKITSTSDNRFDPLLIELIKTEAFSDLIYRILNNRD